MPRSIFVSLPVADVKASRTFYEAIGFTINEKFSDENSACVVISDTIYVMVTTHARMADFTKLPIGDPRKQTQNLLALSCDEKAGVDDMVTRALANGGSEVHPPEDLGFMYSRAFADPDGHSWGPFWMDPAAVMPS
jgi:predicted lactoylglutathione lyase